MSALGYVLKHCQKIVLTDAEVDAAEQEYQALRVDQGKMHELLRDARTIMLRVAHFPDLDAVVSRIEAVIWKSEK